MKNTTLNEARFLSLLEKVLPTATADTQLANRIYEQVAKEVRLISSLNAFEKFCSKGSLPDLEPATVEGLNEQLANNFGAENVVVEPLEDSTGVAVEINLPDVEFKAHLKVQPPGSEEENDAPFVPFPAALPDDPELVWLLGRRENLGPDEASRALANIAEEFWATKKGQTLQKQGVEKNFAEFLSNVPAAALRDSGLKRFHKDPEALRVLRLVPDAPAPELE